MTRGYVVVKHLFFGLMVCGLAAAVVVPTNASAMSTQNISTPLAPLTQFAALCEKSVIGFPAWYNGLECDGTQPVFKDINNLWIVCLNILEMLIVGAMYLAGGYVVWGGFKYIKSQGESAKVSEAKMAIIQAVAGLCIALASIAIVRFVQGLMTSSGTKSGLFVVDITDALLTNILNGVIAIAGAVAVAFVVVGALKYSSSQGDPSATAQGKEMIIYALVGMIVVVFAFAIINFATSKIL